MKPAQAHAQADYALAILDAQSDKWAEEINLTSLIKKATSPMDLKAGAPDEVRQRFRLQMEAHIDAIARQAFREGMYRGITGLQDERAAMEAAGINPDDVKQAAYRVGKDVA